MTLFGTLLILGVLRLVVLSGPEARQRFLFGLVNLKNRVKLRELKQVRDLPAGAAQFELSPWLSFGAFTLWAGIPIAVVVFEYGGSAFRADHLGNSAQGHDQFTESTAVDIGHILQVQQDL